MAILKDVGIVTAYGYAKENGYEGTESEYGQLMANFANAAAQAVAAKDDAVQAKEDAVQAKEDAVQAKEDAVQAKEDAETARTEAKNYAESVLRACPTDTASGPIASFPDGADGVPVKSLVVNVEPVQDLHGYDAPWPAGGGKNLLNPGGNETIAGITKTVNTDGTIRFNGTATGTADFYFNGTTSTGITLDIPDGTYRLYGTEEGSTSTYRLFMIYTKDGTTIYANGADHTSIEWTSTATGRLFLRVYSGATVDVTLKLSFVLGVQDAWSPYSNYCPITGWDAVTVTRAGANLLNPSKYVQRSGYNNLSVNASGNVLTITGYTTGGRFACFNVPTKVGQTYTVKLSSYSNVTFAFLHESETEPTVWGGWGPELHQNTAYTYTAAQPWAQVCVECSADNATVTDLQFEVGSTATTWAAYSGTTYPLALPSTVYGGTLTYDGDGVWTVTVDRGYKQLDGTETLSSFYQRRNGEIYFMISGVEGVKYSSSGSATCTIQSDVYGLNSISPDAAYMSTTFYGFYICSNSDRIRACIKNVANRERASAWITANTPTLVYELATPITYTLTTEQVVNTLKGQNNFWSDTGNTSVTYRADIQLYIQKMIAAALNS